jgi:hypothetical protein
MWISRLHQVLVSAHVRAGVVHLAIPPSAKGLRPAPVSLFWSRFRRVSEVRHRDAPESDETIFSLASSSSRPCGGKKGVSVMCKMRLRDSCVDRMCARGVGPYVSGEERCRSTIRVEKGYKWSFVGTDEAKAGKE